MVTEEHEVVISGIGGKFPDCSSLAEFQEKLFTSQSLLRPDIDRWNDAVQEKPYFSGKIPDWNRFDNAFFGISGKLLNNCDPFMGLMLERSFEAMVDAGLNPFSLKSRNVAVISASSNSDAESIRTTGGLFLDGNGMVGHSRTMMANRISYFFDFRGPSHSMDSSWVSAAAGLQEASWLVARGVVESALVVSCNLATHNAIDLEYSQINYLTETGKCRPFDAKADGVARSEGVVCMFLQRSSQAKRRYCSLVKSRVCFLGDRPAGFLHLDDHLARFLTEFYADTGLKPKQIGYVEAAGLSILEKDSEELNAIARVFKGKENCPMLVGSVTGNLGISDALAAFVSLAKVVVAMETGLIPPTLHFSNGNPNVDAFKTGELKVATEPTILKTDFVAINNLSFNGAAAHILVGRNCHTKPLNPLSDGLPRLVIFQARHEEGAKHVTKKVKSMSLDAEYVSMVNDVFQTPVPAYLWRGYAVVPSDDNKQNVKAYDPISRPVWWVFSGMGSQWPAMGRELIRLPVFASAIACCDRALRPMGVDLTHIITCNDPRIFDNILNCFVGITAIQVGLVDILRSIGISPEGVVGHSVGELGCAYADGCLTAEQTVLAAYARGKASKETNVIPGMMAAVGLGHAQIKDEVPDTIDVACHNASDSCTLSGPSEDIGQFVEQLTNRGVFAKAVSAGGIAYHSRYIRNVAPKLLEYLKQVLPEPKRRSSRWISSSVPESHWNSQEASLCSAEYHTNNLLNPVLFEEACRYIPKDALVIEIAPRGLLQAILRRSLGKDSINMSLTSRQAESNINHLLNCIGQLYLHNIAVDVNALFPAVQYPVSRGTPGLSDLVTWDHDNLCYQDYISLVHMLIHERKTQKALNISKLSPDFITWKERCLHGEVVVPFSQLLIYTWEMMFAKLQLEKEEMSVVIEDAIIVENITVTDQSEFNKTALISFLPNTCCFEISVLPEDKMSSKNIVTGKLHKKKSLVTNPEDISEEISEMDEVEGGELYKFLSELGLEFGSEFQLIKELLIGTKSCIAQVAWTGNLASFLDSLFNILVFLKSDSEQELYLPSSVTKLTMDPILLKNIPTDTVVKVQYNWATNTLTCSGIHVFGLTLRRALRPIQPTLKCTEMKLQPYFDTNLSLQELVTSSWRLVSEAGFSCWASKCQVPTLTLVVTGHTKSPSPFAMLLQEILKQEQGTDCAVRELELNRVAATLPSDCPGLLLATDSALLPALAEAVPSSCQLYCLTRMTLNGNTVHYKLFTPILVSKGKNEMFVLLKRVESSPELKIYEIDSLNWLSGLRKLVASINENTTVVAVSRKLNYKTVLPKLALEPYVNRLRLMFVPESVPGGFFKSPLFTAQLALNLPVSILSNGVWNFIKPTSTLLQTQETLSDACFKSDEYQLVVDCISQNATTLSNDGLTSKVEYVDYSGVKNNSKVMGFGRFDADSHQMSPDPWLQWPVPHGWSMEEAATVPVAYSLAYYCILIKGDLQSGDNVLVNAALSLVGQAVVTVALQVGATVYAYVNDNNEAKQLLKLFPKLMAHQVLERLIGSNANVAVRKLVKGGVDLAVNCLRGEGMQACLQALAFKGKFVHLGHIDIEDRESIGMMTFLKNTSFYGVNLNNIANGCETIKRKLKEFITNGIQQGHIKPLKRMSFSSSLQNNGWNHFAVKGTADKTVIFRKEQNSNSALVRSLQNNPDHLCIIAGRGTECLLSVSKWLATHGATKFVILSNEDQEESYYNRRLNRLVNKQRCTLFLSALSRLDSQEEADELFKEIYRIGTVSTIFIVALDDYRAKVLEESSNRFSQDVRFVSLMCSGASKGISVKVGSSVTSVQSLLPYLPLLLADSNGHARSFVVEDVESSQNKGELDQCRLPLPRSLDQLVILGQHCSGASVFSEVTTLSPHHRYICRDLLPVFILPATIPATLQPLTGRLNHPAFCCKLPPSVQSVNQLAQALMKDLLQVQSKGPFTLVGESWSGPIALQLAILLETQGYQVELILLEGLPSTVKAAIKALGDNPKDIKASLIAACFNLTKNVSDQSAETRSAVRSGLDRLVSQLMAVTHFQPVDHLFQGHVMLVTSSTPAAEDLDDLALYCKQNPRIISTGSEDHDQLIASCRTASAVNENTAFTWNT